MDQALIALLKKKQFEYITVSELCETAGVNRSTFYLHYETIGDLLDETAQYLIEDFFSCFSAGEKYTFPDPLNSELHELNFICEEYLTPYLTYIKENKEVFSTALANINNFGLEKIYKWMFENFFNPILERHHYPEADKKYVMVYYLTGITAIIHEWVKGDCEKPIPDISRIIQICIFGLNGQINAP